MKKDLLVLCIVGVMIAFLVTGTKIQSVDDYYLTHLDEIAEGSETVFLGIRCDTILDNWGDLDPNLRYEKYVPGDGILLPLTEYALRPGDTVFETLNRAVRHNRIQMACVYSYQYSSVYVQGINHLFEFSCGPLSGWMYQVNGRFPNYGCSQYKLKDGDVVEWMYTCDLGRDVGGDFWNLGATAYAPADPIARLHRAYAAEGGEI
ncbi:MAG: DUF4430 domain-containing protein [Clostridiales bacterium]|jgi:hypothetical protein|nr:DUF4430 domain-containing protein [Clostridiales bacterium]